jgi:N-acetylglucosamine-6-sulfatase
MNHLTKHALSTILLLPSVLWAAPPAQPNIVFILVDDLRWDELGCTGHPYVRTPVIDRLADEGVLFRNAFATTPLCSPSRATILTGQYAHTHGIIDNTDRSAASHRLETFPQALQRSGYDTAFVGKWHMGNDASPRPGFSFWVGLEGQGSSNDSKVNKNGESVSTMGYVTDMLTAQALEFLATPRKAPFLLFLSHKALHPETVQRSDGSLSDPSASTFVPAERHARLYDKAPIPRRPNAQDKLEDKVALQQQIPGLPPLGPATGSSDAAILGRQRMLAAIDDSLGRILHELETQGKLDQTIVVLTSDHGYFYGEHGLSVERRLAYEESIRIPLLMRYPPLIGENTEREQMVLTIDLAPTLLELAHAPTSPALQGASLVPLFSRADASSRQAFLIEYYSDKVFPRMKNMGYQAVRTTEWKLIHYLDQQDADELYDLSSDPFEMRNLVHSPGAASDLGKMREELSRQLHITQAPSRASK